jgi:hypothetical protein
MGTHMKTTMVVMFKYYGFSYAIKIINHVLNYTGVCLQLGFVVNFVRQVDW